MNLFSEPMITPQQAAERIGVTIQTIAKWMKMGVLRAYKVSHRYYIPEAAIAEIVKSAKEQ